MTAENEPDKNDIQAVAETCPICEKRIILRGGKLICPDCGYCVSCSE